MTYDKLPKIVKYLEEKKKATPSAIASHIKSDIRTTNKMLACLSNKEINLVKCQSLDTGKRIISSYSLAKEKTKFNGGKKYV